MSAFRKGKGKVLQIYVGSRAGYKQRSTGTTIPAEARKIERMCQGTSTSTAVVTVFPSRTSQRSQTMASPPKGMNRRGFLASLAAMVFVRKWPITDDKISPAADVIASDVRLSAMDVLTIERLGLDHKTLYQIYRAYGGR